jgi:type IV pilus assembly protein PilB
VNPNVSPVQRIAGNLVGRSRSESHGVLPLSFANDVLRVGYAGADDRALRRKLRQWARCDVQFVPMSSHDISDGLLTLFGPRADLGTKSETDQIYDELLHRIGDVRASNAFLEFAMLPSGEEAGRIRLDVEGEITVERELSLETYQRLVMSITTQAIQGEALNPQVGQRGKLTVQIDGRELNLRVSTYPIFHPKIAGLQKIVLRYLQQSQFLPELGKLGMTPEQVRVVSNALANPKCTIIVGAPPGQGKSTTFYSMMGLFDLATRNVYAIEDPPEIFYPGITQTPIAPARNWTYEAALTELLRQSPDFVFVGEMLNRDIADLAMSANVRGVPLGTTMHADDALAIVVALRNLGVNPLTIAGGLSVLISQRLVPVLCDFCKVLAKATERLEHHLNRLGWAGHEPTVYTRGPGCDECLDRGVIGRKAIFEIIPITREMRELVRQSQDDALLRLARQEGYVTMLERGVIEVLRGTIGVEALAFLPESDAHELAISPRAKDFLMHLKAVDASRPRALAAS